MLSTQSDQPNNERESVCGVDSGLREINIIEEI